MTSVKNNKRAYIKRKDVGLPKRYKSTEKLEKPSSRDAKSFAEAYIDSGLYVDFSKKEAV